jgi:hypothetical protein
VEDERIAKLRLTVLALWENGGAMDVVFRSTLRRLEVGGWNEMQQGTTTTS